MARTRKTLTNPGPIREDEDDQIVDTLVRVASGPEHCFNARREDVLRLQPEFEPLVQLAIDDPDELYKREFSARLQELRQGGATCTLGAAITTTGRSVAAWIPDFRDIHAVLTRGVLLLLDPTKQYGSALCRCGHCARFYLARRNPKGGPANRVYCTPKCRSEAHEAARGERGRARDRQPKQKAAAAKHK
jgi:hypothetical protein